MMCVDSLHDLSSPFSSLYTQLATSRMVPHVSLGPLKVSILLGVSFSLPLLHDYGQDLSFCNASRACFWL